MELELYGRSLFQRCPSKRAAFFMAGLFLLLRQRHSVQSPTVLPPRAALLQPLLRPWTRTEAPARLRVPGSAAECARLGRERAREVIDAPLVAALYGDQQCFGLSLLRGAVGGGFVGCMREEAVQLQKQGRLTPSGDPSEPQLTEQYKKYIGDVPTLTILGTGQAEDEGLQGHAYGSAFLCGVCERLSALRPNGHESLEPGTLQLACYNGGGVSYHVHEDYVCKEGIDVERLPEHHWLSFKRRITAILYLQDKWQDGWGGAFRAHAARPNGGEPSPDSFVDVQPEGGSLLLFRSDMPHEVLPTFGQRFALSLWCHAAGP